MSLKYILIINQHDNLENEPLTLKFCKNNDTLRLIFRYLSTEYKFNERRNAKNTE